MDRKNLLQFLSLPIICSAVSNANFSSSAHIQCANFSCTQIFISITTRDELAQEVWAHLRYSRSTNTLWGATHLMQVWWFPKKHPHFSCTMWTNQRSSLPLPSSFLGTAVNQDVTRTYSDTNMGLQPYFLHVFWSLLHLLNEKPPVTTGNDF